MLKIESLAKIEDFMNNKLLQFFLGSCSGPAAAALRTLKKLSHAEIKFVFKNKLKNQFFEENILKFRQNLMKKFEVLIEFFYFLAENNSLN